MLLRRFAFMARPIEAEHGVMTKSNIPSRRRPSHGKTPKVTSHVRWDGSVEFPLGLVGQIAFPVGNGVKTKGFGERAGVDGRVPPQ
jgi:hypothetical protein